MKFAYLDIETNYVGAHTDQQLFRDYKNHLITVLGVRVIENGNDQFFQPIGADITKKELLQILGGVQRIFTFNGRSKPDPLKNRVGFDFPIIAAQLGVVLDKEFDHTDLLLECWRRNLYGGQKIVEQKLGLQRKLPGKDGAWACEVWRKYLKTQKEQDLNELLTYNREDVFMLREIELRLQKM